MDETHELGRRFSDTCPGPRSTSMVSPERKSSLEYSHPPHFALIYLDHDGRPQVEASPSIAGCGGAIFTPDLTDRFMELTTPSCEVNTFQFGVDPMGQASQSPCTAQSSSGWWPAGQTRPAELIPCEWQSHPHRRKRRDAKRTGMVNPRPPSHSPPPTPPPGRTILRVGNRDLLRRYYEKAFEDFQQLNCRAIAKSYIKLVEPRKQVHYPYNGKKVVAGVSQRVDPEKTKPRWWPIEVPHREPDHLLKRDRLQLLVHILCELKDSHGVTAEKLRDAAQDVRRQITPAHRLQVLDEIYFVRQMEERFLGGEIGANTLVQVTQTHLPEAVYQDDELDASPHSPLMAPATAHPDADAHDVTEEHGNPSTIIRAQQHRSLPMSPATSESSGPRRSPVGVHTTYPLGMVFSTPPPQTSSASRCMSHPVPLYNHHGNDHLYFGAPFAPAMTEKPPAPEYWQHGHGPDNAVTHHGY